MSQYLYKTPEPLIRLCESCGKRLVAITCEDCPKMNLYWLNEIGIREPQLKCRNYEVLNNE